MQTKLTSRRWKRQKKPKKRDWSRYNRYQVEEKLTLFALLNDAINSMEIEYSYKGNGRPPFWMGDMVKCLILKTLNGDSSRRTTADLYIANTLGIISAVPHYNSICNYMLMDQLTGYLESLYRLIAVQVKDIETLFSTDSTGYGGYNTVWVSSKKKPKHWKSFNKLHVIIGTRTNMIAVAKITSANVHDTVMFTRLLKLTCRYFTPKEVYGDSGYLSMSNAVLVKSINTKPFFKPKKNTKLASKKRWWIGAQAWDEMVNLWKTNEAKFRESYGKRNNVESTFSSMKMKYLSFIRSKKPVSQKSKILTRVCCHNFSMLVRAIFELDLRPDFRNRGH